MNTHAGACLNLIETSFMRTPNVSLSTFHFQFSTPSGRSPVGVGLSAAIFLASQARQPRIFATIPNAHADIAN
ncbi:hypothetical protein EZS27_003831 [termite gut metagenome]|uniref:Uncharacterized protein n=1 Tax=termite gut metagenome TaxID=433724 RepID=A0A5J4SRM5_9ZZZZ